jgi:hypothetical protein
VHVPYQAEITQSTLRKRPSGLMGKGHFLLLHQTHNEGFAYESREADYTQNRWERAMNYKLI